MVSLSTRYSFFKRWLKSKTHVDLHHTEPVPYTPFLTYCSNALPLISSGTPQTKEHRVADAMIEATLWLS
jgi:hypothetical protein